MKAPLVGGTGDPGIGARLAGGKAADSKESIASTFFYSNYSLITRDECHHRVTLNSRMADFPSPVRPERQPSTKEQKALLPSVV